MPIEFLCAVCMEPIEQDADGRWVHEDEKLDKEHAVKPVRKDCC